MEKKKVKTSKKKIAKVITGAGRAYILATFNNTVITITDTKGNVICWGSCGHSGFKGARKSTPYAATVACDNVGKKAIEKGVREVAVYIKGPGMGRLPSVKALKAAGLNITSITDKTSTPHNGCRPRKRRRM